MTISHWILVSLCFASLAIGASVFLFTMLPINGAVISLCATSLLAKRFRFKIKGYLIANFGFVTLYVIVGYMAAMNDLRMTPWFNWMFFEVY
jgi:hypothetical protein